MQQYISDECDGNLLYLLQRQEAAIQYHVSIRVIIQGLRQEGGWGGGSSLD